MTETELEELEALLSSVEGGSASLPVDGLHGFLSALVMSGGDTRAEPLLPWILSPMPGLPLDLDHVPQARRVGELVSKMLTSIDIELDDPDYLFSPMVRVYPHRGEERADGCVWCAGFLRGMAHAWDRWSSLCDLQDMASLLWPIHQLAALAQEPALEVDRTFFRTVPDRPLSPAQCEALTEALTRTLEEIAERITEHEVRHAMGAIARGEEASAWREDGPCPCGSGRGFSVCCGGQRVLH